MQKILVRWTKEKILRHLLKCLVLHLWFLTCFRFISTFVTKLIYLLPHFRVISYFLRFQNQKRIKLNLRIKSGPVLLVKCWLPSFTKGQEDKGGRNSSQHIFHSAFTDSQWINKTKDQIISHFRLLSLPSLSNN